MEWVPRWVGSALVGIGVSGERVRVRSPTFNFDTSFISGICTLTTMLLSQAAWALTMFAPASVSMPSVKLASKPAPVSMFTEYPSFTRVLIAAGARATRRSFGKDSRGQPIVSCVQSMPGVVPSDTLNAACSS